MSRFNFCCLSLLVFTCTFPFAASESALASNVSGPAVTLLDPVPSLLSGAQVTTNSNVLASKGRPVVGVGADGVTELVLRIPANAVGEQFSLTVLNDQGQQSQSSVEDGGLGAVGSTTFTASQITVTAVSTTRGAMAFAIYGAPLDFPRPEGQDDLSAERSISVQAVALDTQMTSQTAVTILRPPLVLIHGLWGSAQSWSNFTPLTTDSRFSVNMADYSTPIGSQILSYKPSYPIWAIGSLANSTASALGFAYNAPKVLAQITQFITNFRKGTNPGNAAVAAVQADILAHSMGGDIARTFPFLKSFYANNTFALGPVHKVITIATPHWGSPLAIQLVNSNNQCVRGILALAGSPSFTSVTFTSGVTVSGGVGDLGGDGFGGSLSPALKRLDMPIAHPLPTALIQGLESQAQLDGLDTSGTAAYIRFVCSGDSLADNLTSSRWPTVFGQESDSIVPAMSEVAGLGTFTVVNGVIHSASAESLGFGPPAELDSAGGIPGIATMLLNTPINNSIFVPLPQ